MGEFSKRIGEIGEDIVADFLKLIGWVDVQRGIDILSSDPEKHGKETHGIDGFFHYKSPMIKDCVDNVLISVKFSKDQYPNSVSSKFKSYYTDIASAVESFKRSEERNETLNNYSEIEGAFDRGVIFWLNNKVEDKINLVQKLFTVEVPKGYLHDGIYLVDNRQLEFIYESIHFSKMVSTSGVYEFVYISSGLNNDNDSHKNGNLMPIQYLTSSILPIKIANNNVSTLLLFTQDNFNEDDLLKLMGLAKNIGNNLQNKTIICFPDYTKLEHEHTVIKAKQALADRSFTDKLEIRNYYSPIRG